MKQARMAHTGSSGFYLQQNSPLRTVFEDSPPEDRATNRAKYERLSWAPSKLQRKVPSNRRRQRPDNLHLCGIYRTPSALLHNDWYLNQLFNEVSELYRPGALTGYPINFNNQIAERRISLLRDLVPGCKIQPLLPAHSHGPEHGNRTASRQGSANLTRQTPPQMPPKRKAVRTADPSSKKPPGRKNLFEDEKHIFSARSKLVNQDIHSILAEPLAWSCLSEEEKDEIRSLLPPGIPYDETGAPDQSFLRYDSDWRYQVRLFAEDLEAGRYEPEWLEQAKEAAEQRRYGDFDQWKEQQFEEFWGQKSDAHADMMAGEALKVRLSEMISSGLFHVGDILVYTRLFGKGRSAFIVEKECTITEISGGKITVTLPSGRARKPRKATTHLASPSAPVIASGRRDRATSEEATAQSPKAADHASGINRLRRSNSVQSPGHVSQQAHDSLEMPTNNSLDNELKTNKKRFGLFGSVRRQISQEPENEQEQTTGITKLFRRKPTPEMQILPNAAPDNNLDDSDSPLSDLGDEEGYNTQPPPWEIESVGHASKVAKKKADSVSDSITVRARNSRSSESPQRIVVSRRPLPVEKKLETPLGMSNMENPSRTGDSIFSYTQPKNSAAVFESEDRATRTPSRDGSEQGAHAGAALVTVTGINSLIGLEQKILEVDGRRPAESRGNPWHMIRCKRGKIDLGALWEMREEYYKAKHG